MSRRGNCWDDASQERFFGHMKDEIGAAWPVAASFGDAKAILANWMDYYNNDRGQWQPEKLSPKEFFDIFCVSLTLGTL